MSKSAAGRLQAILELIRDTDDEGNSIEPILKLTNEEIMELLNNGLENEWTICYTFWDSEHPSSNGSILYWDSFNFNFSLPSY